MADPVTAAPAPATAAQPAAPQPPEAAPPPTPEPAPAPRKFKAKINGRDVELDEAEVIESGLTAAQIRRAAQERFDAAQRAMGEVQRFRQAFEQDPVRALRDLSGQSKGFRESIEKWLTEEFQIETADPETQKRLMRERDLADRERKLKEAEDAQARSREEAVLQHYRQELDTAFSEALGKVGLPKTTEAIRRMAQLGQRYNAMGAQIDPMRLARLVKQDLASEQMAALSELQGDALLNSIPPDVLKRIRAADVARVRAGAQPPGATPPPPAQRQPPPVPQKPGRVNPHLLSREEWYRRNGLDPDRDL